MKTSLSLKVTDSLRQLLIVVPKTLSLDICLDRNIPINKNNKNSASIIWGNNKNITKTTLSTNIYGPNNTLITKNINESLISLSTLVDQNFTITFDKDGAFIQSTINPTNSLFLPRSEDQFWRIDLDDINTLISSNKSCIMSARLHETPQDIRDKVFQLHESMCHPPEDIMSIVISGDDPSWINSGLSTQNKIL
jgi:hypothetical protein